MRGHDVTHDTNEPRKNSKKKKKIGIRKKSIFYPDASSEKNVGQLIKWLRFEKKMSNKRYFFISVLQYINNIIYYVSMYYQPRKKGKNILHQIFVLS